MAKDQNDSWLFRHEWILIPVWLALGFYALGCLFYSVHGYILGWPMPGELGVGDKEINLPQTAYIFLPGGILFPIILFLVTYKRPTSLSTWLRFSLFFVLCGGLLVSVTYHTISMQHNYNYYASVNARFKTRLDSIGSVENYFYSAFQDTAIVKDTCCICPYLPLQIDTAHNYYIPYRFRTGSWKIPKDITEIHSIIIIDRRPIRTRQYSIGIVDYQWKAVVWLLNPEGSKILQFKTFVGSELGNRSGTTTHSPQSGYGTDVWNEIDDYLIGLEQNCKK
jgi:hypothetical protein